MVVDNKPEPELEVKKEPEKKYASPAPMIHEYYLGNFALPAIADIYRRIATSENVIETKSLSPLVKSEKVMNFTNVQKYFADSWHILMVLLISCGDIYIHKTSNNGKMVNFVVTCKTELRNRVMHHEIQFMDFMFDT